MSYLDVEDGLQGYVDALKDTGEWFEMTDAEHKTTLKNAAVYFDKIFYGITMARIATLNALNPGWCEGDDPESELAGHIKLQYEAQPVTQSTRGGK